MSDEVFCIRFNKGRLRLDISIGGGDNYETANVQLKLVSDVARGMVLEETPVIPLKSLMAVSYLIDMSIRRTAAQYEKEVQEMLDKIEQRKHPFKDIGGENEENKEKSKS